MSVTGKSVLTYTDNAALITASIAPPSMTYVDPNPQVTIAKDPVIVMTYTEIADIELETNLKREVLMDVELNGRMERVVDSDDPFKVSIQGDMERTISNSVVLEYQLEREVLSFNVGLEYGLRRVISTSVELEGNITRNIKSKIELLGRLTRVVTSDAADDPGIPEKEYGSFIDKNKLFRVQHDVLDEDVSDNPYFEKQISNLQNAALLTKNQTIIKAINELFVNQRTIFETAFNAFEKFDSKIGDIVEDPELNAKYRALGYRNIIDAIIKLADNIDGIISFIGSQEESLSELGYKDLVEGLNDLNEKIKALTYDYADLTQEEVEWIFKTKDYIPDIKDTVFEALDAMRDEITTFERNVEARFVAFKRETDSTIASYYLAFVEKLEDFEAVSREEIRNIFYDLEEGGSLEDPDNPLAEIIVNFGYELADFKDEIRRNITALSDEINDFTEVTEKEIRKIFSGYDPGEIVPEDPDAVFESTVIEALNTITNKLNSLELIHATDIHDIRAEMADSNEILHNRVLVDLANTEAVVEQYKNEISSRITALQTQHNNDVSLINQAITEQNNVLYNQVLVLLGDLRSLVDLNKTTADAQFASINDRVSKLEDFNDTLSTNLDSLAKAVVRAFREYVAVDETAIRDILAEFEENIMDTDIAHRTYEELSQYIKNEFISIKSTLEELDKRVSILEDGTDPYIVDESDIFAMFPELDISDIEPEFDIDNYPEATEEDIYSMFGMSAADHHTDVNVDDMLDNIATEEDIINLFGLSDQYSSMEDLLAAIQAKQAAQQSSDSTEIADEATEEDIYNMFNNP